MPRQILVDNHTDFTGGLNLSSDEFKIAKTECAEMTNLDISHRGGVSHRLGYQDVENTVNGWALDAHCWYGHPNGACVLTCMYDTDLTLELKGDRLDPAVQWSVGEDRFEALQDDSYIWYEESETAVWRERRSSAEFHSKLYLAAGYSVLEGDGSTQTFTNFASPMVPSDFNDDLDNPTDDKMPAASCIAAWQGSMWVADIFEDGENHPTRVRWSHPNHPKDWHSAHYVDLGGDDGGRVTALIPDGDRLVIFRERKIHAVVGAPPEAIQVFLVSDDLGCNDFGQIAATEQGVYFWNDERGVFRLGQSSIDWVFEKLYPALTTGRMHGEARLAWDNERLYVAVEYDDIDGNEDHTSWFVLDPSLGKKGAWVRHQFVWPRTEMESYPQDPGFETEFVNVKYTLSLSLFFAPPDEDPKFVTSGNGLWLRRKTRAELHPNHDAGPFTQLNEEPFIFRPKTNRAVFRTAWFDQGQPGQLKRFRRADVVGNGLDDETTLLLEVYTDYDSFRRRRYSPLVLDYPSGGAQYGVAVFGTDIYSEGDYELNVVERTPPLGRARAVQMKFIDDAKYAIPPEQFELALPWAINSIAVKYTPYPVRG